MNDFTIDICKARGKIFFGNPWKTTQFLNSIHYIDSIDSIDIYAKQKDSNICLTISYFFLS